MRHDSHRQLTRRRLLRHACLGIALLGLGAGVAGCRTPRERRISRRVRRRTRRRVRRRVAYRQIRGHRVMVVPVDIRPDDVLLLEDGREGTVVSISDSQVVLDVDGDQQHVDAHFEGSVDD